MSPSINLETTYYIKTDNFLLKASGSIEKFKGYKKIYNFKEKTDNEQQLPNLSENEKLTKSNISIKQNFTKPPNRYSEAGLIKKLEELGIGRPSTYVSIFTKLQDRSYIEIKNKSLIPTSKGKIYLNFLMVFLINSLITNLRLI